MYIPYEKIKNLIKKENEVDMEERTIKRITGRVEEKSYENQNISIYTINIHPSVNTGKPDYAVLSIREDMVFIRIDSEKVPSFWTELYIPIIQIEHLIQKSKEVC
jgi:hypothetical protein